jgi:hypothetical protein
LQVIPHPGQASRFPLNLAGGGTTQAVIGYSFSDTLRVTVN